MKTLALVLSAGLASTALGAEGDAKIDFTKQIRPILEKTCVKCHGPEKQKGKLRLDSREDALKGGKNGAVLQPGKADESELYKRIILPPGDDDIMPNEGDPLSKEHTNLIRDWINQGAEWPVEVVSKAEAKPPIGLAKLVAVVPTPAEQKALAKVEGLGIPVRPIAMNVGWREANLALQGTNATDAVIAQLKDISSLVALNLRGSKVTDAGLQSISGLTNLIELHLENTAITDAGVAHLKGLTNLNYLNLYGTSVSDAAFEYLKGLRDLQSLYLWQTQVTPAGVSNLQAVLPQLKIVTGWNTASVEPKEEKKEEPKKEEAKP